MISRLDRKGFRSARAHTLLLYIVLLGSFALRLFRLDAQSFGDDEVLSVMHANVPLATLFAALPSDHTPGYFVLLRSWMLAVGDADFTVRFYSVVFGTLGVALLYVLARRLFSPRVALIAALVAAIDPFAVYYSQEARMYSQLLVCSTAALYGFARALEKPRRVLWITHALVLAAAIYTHYYGLALVIAEAGFVLLERRSFQRSQMRAWLSSLGLAAFLFVPWLPFMPRLFEPRTWLAPVNPLTFPAQLWANFFAGATIADALTPALFGLTLLLLTAGIVTARTSRRGRLVIAMQFVPLALILIGLTLRGQGVLARHLSALLPAFLILIALGIDRATRITPPLGAGAFAALGVIAFASLQNYWYDPHYSRADWRETARFIEMQEQPGDVILFDGIDPQVAFQRYYRGHSRYWQLPELKPRASDAHVNDVLTHASAGAGRVWLVLYGAGHERAADWLNAHGFEGDYGEYAGVYVFPVLLTAHLTPPLTPIRVEKKIDIEPVSYQVGQARAGDFLPVVVTWQNGNESPETDLQVSLRLVDAAGNVLVALDRAPRGGFHPTGEWRPGEIIEDRYALAVPRAVSPGDYALAVLLYDPSDSAPRVQATLGSIHIAPLASGN